MRSFDVVVVGAGIVGCACALECAREGMKVAVVEPRVLGGGATAAGMGHIVVMDDSQAQLALTRFSRQLWQEMRPGLPASSEYEARGTVWVAADDEEMGEVYAKHRTYTSAGIDAVVLNTSELYEAEPNLRVGLAGGLLVPDDAVVYPPTCAGYFFDQARPFGAELIRGSAAVEVGKSEVMLADGRVLHAGRIVMATGADKLLLPWLPVQKRKGHLLITDRYPGFVRHQLVELGYLKSAHKIAGDSVAFNIQPRQTGQLLIGSSRQYGNEDPAADAGILRTMLERATYYMPGLEGLSGIRVWTGFRAATPDKLPLIGPTEDSTVFLAMGFEGLGITNAPGAARLLVDSLMGRRSAIDAAPYLPSRAMSVEAAHG